MILSRPDGKSGVPCALVATLLLAGCSSDGGNWGELLKATQHYWSDDSDAVSLDDAAAIPYATLGLRIDGGPEQILILATDDAGVRLWTSPGHVGVVTRDGRIIRTSGFDTDLSAYAADFTANEDWLHPHSYSWSGDFRDLGIFSARIDCQARPTVRDPVQILGTTLDTVRVEESCESDDLHWSFANTYWVSAETDRVWRSIQHFHPKGPEVEVEYLRPPTADR